MIRDLISVVLVLLVKELLRDAILRLVAGSKLLLLSLDDVIVVVRVIRQSLRELGLKVRPLKQLQDLLLY